MQTGLGRILSIIVGIIVVVLCWTGNITGWFRSEYLFSPNWAYLILIALFALGVIKIIDRRQWWVGQQAQLAAQNAANELRQSEIAAAHAAKDERIAANNASVIEALSEENLPEVWAAIG